MDSGDGIQEANATSVSRLDSTPPFKLLGPTDNGSGARLGELTLPHRRSIQTPHYLAITSRGVVSHLSQDNLQRHTQIKAAYLGLEDCKTN